MSEPIKVGDRVRHGVAQKVYTVTAINRGTAWVRDRDQDTYTFSLTHLTPAGPTPEPLPEECSRSVVPCQWPTPERNEHVYGDREPHLIALTPPESAPAGAVVTVEEMCEAIERCSVSSATRDLPVVHAAIALLRNHAATRAELEREQAAHARTTASRDTIDGGFKQCVKGVMSAAERILELEAQLTAAQGRAEHYRELLTEEIAQHQFTRSKLAERDTTHDSEESIDGIT